MEPENNTQNPTITVIILRFLGGVVLGLLLLLVYLIYAALWSLSGIEWNVIVLSTFILVAILCGVLSAIFGKRFIDTLIAVIFNPP